MVKQKDLVKPISLEDCGSHGNTDDEFEEYSEEEMLSEEESDENLCMPPKKEGSCEKLSWVEGSCAEKPNEDSSSDEESAEEVSCEDESNDEDSCPEEPNEEDTGEKPEASSAEYPTEGTILEEASDEDPSDVSYEDISEEEFFEDFEEEPNGGEPLGGSMDQLPLVIDCDGVPSLLEENKADHIFSESKTSAESSCNQYPRESSNLFTDAIVSKQPDDPLASSKKRRSRWDIKAEAPILVNESGDLDKKRKTRWSSDANAEAPVLVNDNADLNKRRKTRWSSDETQLNMSCTLKLPDSLKEFLSDTYNDKRIQRLNVKLQEINQKLEGSAIVNEQRQEESAPSPQPTDVGLDSTIDTKEINIRLKLLKQKHKIISELLTKSKKNDEPKHLSKNHHLFRKKLYIPLKEYPNYNFVGLILGPNGNTIRKMEKETGTIINIRGKGSNLEIKNQAGDEDMHVLIQSGSQTNLDSAVSMVEKLLVPVDDQHNYHKAAQLRELAKLRGVLNEGLWEMKRCDICGNSCHPTSDCPLVATSKANANVHTGSGTLFSSLKSQLSPSPLPSVAEAYVDVPKENDSTTLVVSFLPLSVSTDKLKELFLPYGSICRAIVVMDKRTGLSKRCGFVKYSTASDAAKALEKMNGYMIDGRKIAVRIAVTSPPLKANQPTIPPPALNANLPKFPGPAFIPPTPSNANLLNYHQIPPHPSTSNVNLPNYPGPAAIPQEIPKPNFWPGPPGSILSESFMSFRKSYYNSSTYTESVPLQSSTSLGSSFQSTSLGKHGYMMDGKNLNVTVTATPPPSLNANLPNYSAFAATPQEIPEQNCWPSSTASKLLPESGTYFSKSSHNSFKYTESVPFRSSTYLASTCQTSISSSSSQFPGFTATSNELASFPGYLKSFDPPNQLDQSMPSSSLSSRAPSFIGNFSGNQMNPTWR